MTMPQAGREKWDASVWQGPWDQVHPPSQAVPAGELYLWEDWRGMDL